MIESRCHGSTFQSCMLVFNWHDIKSWLKVSYPLQRIQPPHVLPSAWYWVVQAAPAPIWPFWLLFVLLSPSSSVRITYFVFVNSLHLCATNKNPFHSSVFWWWQECLRQIIIKTGSEKNKTEFICMDGYHLYEYLLLHFGLNKSLKPTFVPVDVDWWLWITVQAGGRLVCTS